MDPNRQQMLDAILKTDVQQLHNALKKVKPHVLRHIWNQLGNPLHRSVSPVTNDQEGKQLKRSVHLFVTGHTHFHDEGRPGNYRCILVDVESGKTTCLPTRTMLGKTPNQAMILGIIAGLESLKYPCSVSVVTKGTFGAAKLIPKGPNADLLAAMQHTIQEKGHEVQFIVDPALVEKAMSSWK